MNEQAYDMRGGSMRNREGKEKKEENASVFELYRWER